MSEQQAETGSRTQPQQGARGWRGWIHALTPAEWARLGGFGGAVALLHIVGWGLFLFYARHNPALAGLGTLAYTFGLRHAFDADHIAAIDNTTRKFLQDGKRSVGVGFFFSLGHSTVVFSLAAGLAVAAKSVNSKIPTFQDFGGYIGASVSGVFLLLIGMLNLMVLLDILGVFRKMKRGHYDEQRLEQALLDQGLMSRFFLKRVGDRIDASWKMYPLGILFGLGFDTATEIGLLAVAAGVAAHHVPFLAILSLPIIFAAGMSLMDTADGAFMSQAYGWAFSNPIRKVYYNITVTSLSVAVALIIGMIELLQVLSEKFSLDSGFWSFLNNLNFGNIGYFVVGIFVLTWAASVTVWKTRRIEERWSTLVERS
jgi:nickel/cobalt transporter (NiCoT) family protein